MISIKNLLMGSTIRAAHISRYSSIPVLHKESVAEHSYYVALYSALLAADIGLSVTERYEAMQMAIVHDIEECLTGDFLRSFKKSSPELDSEIHRAASICADKVFKEIGETSIGHQEWKEAKGLSMPGRVVRFADFLSVVSYLCKEAALGNRYARVMMSTELMEYLKLFHTPNFLNNGYREYLNEVEGIIRRGWENVQVTV